MLSTVEVISELPGLKYIKGVLKIGKAAKEAKAAEKGARAVKDVEKGAGVEKAEEKAGKAVRRGDKEGVVVEKRGKTKRRPSRRCELLPYDELLCAADQEAHHVVPDWMLRIAKRGGPEAERIPDMPSLEGAPAICLDKGGGEAHSTAHKHTDKPAERIARSGRATGVPGTIKLGQAKLILTRDRKSDGRKEGRRVRARGHQEAARRKVQGIRRCARARRSRCAQGDG